MIYTGKSPVFGKAMSVPVSGAAGMEMFVMKEISSLIAYRPDVKVVDATLRDGGLVNEIGRASCRERV